MNWHDENGNEQHDNMVPMDLTTRNKQEYLVARDSHGEIQHIRLDKISHTNVDEVNRQ
jgi:transcriptional antiterminator Rof (Rho-off)